MRTSCNSNNDLICYSLQILMLGVTFFGMFLGDWFNKHPQFEIMFVYVRDVLNFLGIRMVREHCFIPELATELDS